MAKLLFQVLAAAVASLIVSTSMLPGARAIETVDTLDVSKYLGRWYTLYINTITSATIVSGTTSCITSDYGLDEPTGNITVLYSSRASPAESLRNTTGYIYYDGTNVTEPGQLKQKLADVRAPGDYWVVGLGPALFGVDGLYDWAIVTGPSASFLFVLVRDVLVFEEYYAEGVLSLVDELGFNNSYTEPLLVEQEGCLSS